MGKKKGKQPKQKHGGRVTPIQRGAPLLREVWWLNVAPYPAHADPFGALRVVAITTNSGLARAADVIFDISALGSVLIRAVRGGLPGTRPGRPIRLEVPDRDLADAVAVAARSLGITVRVSPPGQGTAMPAGLAEHLGSGPPPYDPAFVGSPVLQRQLVEASMAYATLAPWDWLTDSELVELSSHERPFERPIACVLGNAGISIGIAFYRSRHDYDRTRQLGGIADTDAVVLQLESTDELDDFGRAIFASLGGGKAGLYPVLMRVSPGNDLQDLSPAEAQELLRALGAVNACFESLPETIPANAPYVGPPLPTPEGPVSVTLHPTFLSHVEPDPEPEPAAQKLIDFESITGWWRPPSDFVDDLKTGFPDAPTHSLGRVLLVKAKKRDATRLAKDLSGLRTVHIGPCCDGNHTLQVWAGFSCEHRYLVTETQYDPELLKAAEDNQQVAIIVSGGGTRRSAGSIHLNQIVAVLPAQLSRLNPNDDPSPPQPGTQGLLPLFDM